MCQEVWDGPPPLKHAIFGADEVGEDLGYGPARMTTPGDVTRVASALAALSVRDLLRRYDGKRMEELSIYPGNWESDWSWRGDLKRDYTRLRGFYERAAKSGDGLLAWIE